MATLRWHGVECRTAAKGTVAGGSAGELAYANRIEARHDETATAATAAEMAWPAATELCIGEEHRQSAAAEAAAHRRGCGCGVFGGRALDTT